MPADCLPDGLIEPLAIAICWGEFSALQQGNPVDYWERVHPHAKADYLNAARRLLNFVLDGGRLAPRTVSDDVLQRYMKVMRLANLGNARRHYAAIRQSLPTIWQEQADGTIDGGRNDQA